MANYCRAVTKSPRGTSMVQQHMHWISNYPCSYRPCLVHAGILLVSIQLTDLRGAAYVSNFYRLWACVAGFPKTKTFEGVPILSSNILAWKYSGGSKRFCEAWKQNSLILCSTQIQRSDLEFKSCLLSFKNVTLNSNLCKSICASWFICFSN